MWKLGLRPRNSFSGNTEYRIQWDFSCSAQRKEMTDVRLDRVMNPIKLDYLAAKKVYNSEIKLAGGDRNGTESSGFNPLPLILPL
jgi:hypothetical protein